MTTEIGAANARSAVDGGAGANPSLASARSERGRDD